MANHDDQSGNGLIVDKVAFAELFRIGKMRYSEGKNVMRVLSGIEKATKSQVIEIVYSLQSGLYTKNAATELCRLFREEAHDIIRPVVEKYRCQSALDCGIGEGDGWLEYDGNFERFYGVDASYHRMTYCKNNLAQLNNFGEKIFIKANMFSMPFAPLSVDAVFSFHAIEPNGDADSRTIINQIFRIARKLVVLFEPNYREASEEMKQRMIHHQYACNIWNETDEQPGFTIIEEGRNSHSVNPENATSYRIFKRDEAAPDVPTTVPFLSPVNRRPLMLRPDCLADVDGCFAFAKIAGIYCLAPEDAIFTGLRP